MPTLDAAEVARRWMELYNDGTPDFYGSDRFLELYAEDIDWRELPTVWSPSGRSGDLNAVRAAVESAQSTRRNRRVTLRELIADGDRTVMRYHWEAEVAADGLGVPPGSTLEVEVAQFLTVRGGKVVQSIEYLSRVRRP